MWPLLLSLPCLPPDLAGHAQRRAVRPTLSGPDAALASADGAFVVHWTDWGADAIPLDDADGDGVPDAVTRTLDALALARDAYLARGYRPLEPDNGWGGSAGLDLYLRALDTNGFAYPALPADPDAVSSCYMEVDVDLIDSPGELLESVVVHELHHCVQFAYTINTDSWLYESFATFEQYQHVRSDTLDLAAQVLWGLRLAEPDRSLSATGDRYEYAGMIFPKFLVERGGAADLGRLDRAWEALSAWPDWRQGLDAFAFAEWGLGLDGLYLDHATWNAFACARDDGQHYAEHDLGCEVEVSVPVSPLVEGEPFSPTHRQRSHTAAYFEVANAGDARPLALTCGSPGAEGVEAAVRLVALDAEGRAGESAGGASWSGEALDARLAGEVDPEGAVLVVFVSTGEEPSAPECVVERVEPVPTQTGRCASGPGAPAGAALMALAAGLRRRRRAG